MPLFASQPVADLVPVETIVQDSVASTTAVALPAGWAGKVVKAFALGVNVYLRFGVSDVTVSITTNGVPAAAGPHVCLAAGASDTFEIPAGATHFAHIASATGGEIFLIRCDQGNA
jgi:hypothetical protein